VWYTKRLMPITLQAKKKQRHDRKRNKQNTVVRRRVALLVKTARIKPTTKSIHDAFQMLDKAAKRRVVHPNKAARTKSRLAKLLLKK